MLQEKSKELIKEAGKVEHDYAVEEYGKTFVSTHELYAVLKEEVEEAVDQTVIISNMLNKLWEAVKNDDELDTLACLLNRIYTSATHSVAELLQVMAVVDKGLDTLKRIAE